MTRGWSVFLLAALATVSATRATAQGSLLVVAKTSQELAIVDGATLQVTARVPVGENPHEVVVGPDGATAYVSNFGEGTLHSLAVVDLRSRAALPSIDVSPLVGPHGLALRDGALWFTADRSKALAELDLETRRIASVLGTGQDRTHMLWISPDGKKIVASNAGSGTFSVFDAVMVTPTVPAGAPPPPASYTAPGWAHTLVPVGPAAEGFAVSPDRAHAWVGDRDGTITIVDLAANRVAATIDAGTVGANRLAFTPDGKYVLVTMRAGKELVVIDAGTRQVATRIPIGERGASGVLVQPDGARAFVACPRDHHVAVIDLKTLTLAATVDAGREPDGLAWWAH